LLRYLHQSLQAGGVPFLPKPFIPEQLTHLVREALDASRRG
jgi:CheY-like chemotaxis protein